MSKVKLKVEDLSKEFKINGEILHVLNSISFSVKDREFLTIVGPSGCGKTTLIRLIAGLEKPTRGKIILDDEIINKPSNKIGYVPQEFSLFPWKNVKKNIEFGLKLQGFNKIQSDRKVEELLRLVGLEKFEDYYPKDLSGGMKQKVAVARALAIDQTLLLLDEPLISIDAQNRNKLQDDLLDIWEKSKRTMIFITHNIDEAVYLSDRIIILGSLPAAVKRIVPINLKRPRDRTNSEFNKLRKEILDILSI
ncbi:MAG: ABC transporter ATP-binding protein [Candidatus Hodarchaeota archaeon]